MLLNKLKSLLPKNKEEKSPLFSPTIKKYKDLWFNLKEAGHSPNWQYFYIPISWWRSKNTKLVNWKKEIIIGEVDNIRWPFVSNKWDYILSWREKTKEWSWKRVIIINGKREEIADLNNLEDASYSEDWSKLIFKYDLLLTNPDWTHWKQPKYIRYNNMDIKLNKPNLHLMIWNIYDNGLSLVDNWVPKLRIFITKKFIVEFKIKSSTNWKDELDNNNIMLRPYSWGKKSVTCNIVNGKIEINWKLFSPKILFPNLDLNVNAEN